MTKNTFLLSKLTYQPPPQLQLIRYKEDLANSADPMIGFGNSSLAGFGNVDFGYSIGKIEVTN